MEKEKKEWKIAKIVFGRLIKIDRESHKITIEKKTSDPMDPDRWLWIEETYRISETWDFEDLLEHLDEDVKIKVVDGKLREIYTE